MDDRTRIVALLDYPRQLVRAQIRDRECPHAGFLDKEDGRCQACEATADCHWLHDNEEFAVFSRRPDHELLGALEYAIDYVRGISAADGHNPDRCPCDSCGWLRRAGSLVETRDR